MAKRIKAKKSNLKQTIKTSPKKKSSVSASKMAFGGLKKVELNTLGIYASSSF